MAKWDYKAIIYHLKQMHRLHLAFSKKLKFNFLPNLVIHSQDMLKLTKSKEICIL
jgi:hypothetical protein